MVVLEAEVVVIKQLKLDIRAFLKGLAELYNILCFILDDITAGGKVFHHILAVSLRIDEEHVILAAIGRMNLECIIATSVIKDSVFLTVAAVIGTVYVIVTGWHNLIGH